MKTIKELIEDVVAGDSGGNPEQIATGENSGNVVGNGGGPVKRKKDKSEKPKDSLESDTNK